MKPNIRAEQTNLILAGVYARVSNIERQTGDDKFSIENQVSESRQVVAALPGAVLVGEYVDQERYRVDGALVDPAGWRTDRPAWLRLCADVRAGRINLIVGWKTDRLVRGLKATAMLDDLIRDTGVTVKLCRENFDINMLGFSAAVSRYELSVFQERTDVGRRDRVIKRGLRASDKVPFGYEVLKDERGKTTSYNLKASHAEYLHEMARLFVERYSYREIAERLGVDPDTGRNFLISKIYRLLHNDFYFGALVYQADGSIGEGKYELPWNELVRRAIEGERARRERAGQSAPRGKALYTGVLFCAYCDSPMTVNGGHKTQDGVFHPTYRCSQYCNYHQHKTNVVVMHPNNQITERAVTMQLKEIVSALNESDVEAYVSGLTESLVDGSRIGWLAEQIAALESQAQEFNETLDLKLPTSARSAIITELDKALASRAKFADELTKLQSASAPALDSVREAMIECVRHPELFDGDAETVRAIVRRTFPVLYVLHGKLQFNRIEQ